jgi:hypothetical protein
MVEMEKITSTNSSPFAKPKIELNTDEVNNYNDHDKHNVNNDLKSPLKKVININSVLNNSTETNEKNFNSRDIEKLQVQAKQRDNYLNTSMNNTINNNFNNQNQHQNQSKLSKCRSFINSMFIDINPYLEYLYYLFTIELFFIFLTYTHYPSLDKKNKFLTPIIMGSETSLLGETLIQICRWIKSINQSKDHKYMLSLLHQNDEEKNLELDELNLNSVRNDSIEHGHQRNLSVYSHNAHSRSSSNVERSTASPALLPSVTSSLTNEQELLKEAFITEHLKYVAWGGLNGLLSSYWIEFVTSSFQERRILCVCIDQSVGTVIFQTLYCLFVCLWDGEVEIVSVGIQPKIELTWDSFLRHYAGMLWKYMKLSWIVWPFISFVSFTSLPQEWIFPINCIFTTLFTVVLGL